MSNRWRPNVTVAAIIERDGKFLLVEELIDGKLTLNQPAGHLENHETLIEAVIRETLEETAWHFQPTELVGIYQWAHPTNSEIAFIRFAFTGILLSFERDRPLDSLITRSIWLNQQQIENSIDQHRSPQLLKCVEDYMAGHRYSLELIHQVL